MLQWTDAGDPNCFPHWGLGFRTRRGMPRSFRSRREVAQLSPNLTPLLDVILQLITFFMMLIHFGTKLEGSTVDIKLPVTPAALPGADLALDRLTVAIDAKGRLLANGDTLESDAAEAWWSAQA